jgi:hypothetical protein
MAAAPGGGGLAVAPILGPVGAPQYAQPTILTDAAQAIEQFPQQQQAFQQKQTDLESDQYGLANQRLSVLTRMAQEHPETLSDPKIVGAFQRAYKLMGMEAPTTVSNGKTSIDAQAVGAYAPLHDFLAKNWDTLATMEPTDREKLVSGLGLGQLPESIANIPRKFLQSPAEASKLLDTVRQSIASLNKPGGSLENVIALIEGIQAPLKDAFGDNAPQVMIDSLKPDLYAQLMQKAQLALINARTDDEKAKAKTLYDTLGPKIQEIHSITDLHGVMEQYYPEMAAAAGQRAGAAAENADTNRTEMPYKIQAMKDASAKSQQDAQLARARTKAIQDAAEQGLKFGVKNPSAMVSTLQRDAHETQVRIDALQKSLAQAQIDEQTYKGQPYGQQAHEAAAQYTKELADATADHTKAQDLYNRARDSVAGLNGGTTHEPGKPPADMPAGAVDYYKSLSPTDRAAYLNSPKVPADVRQYLKGVQ